MLVRHPKFTLVCILILLLFSSFVHIPKVFADDTYTLTVDTVGSGSVSLSPPGGTYNLSDVVQLTATPAAGWSFAGWSGDLTSTTNPDNIVITGNMTVTATFTQNQYTVSVTVLPSAGAGSVTPNATGPYHYGDLVVLTESPNSGYTFSGWSGDGAGSGTTRSVTVTGNMAVTATFTQNQYTLSVSVVGTGCSVTKLPNQATYVYGTVVTLTPVAASGWTFSSWSGDLSGSGTPGSITMNGNKVVNATFTQNTYTLTVTPAGSGSGTVAKSPSQATYTYGQIVQLTATANPGSTFAGWSGDLTGSANPASITIDGNKVVTATFTQNEYALTITLNPPAGGSVAKSPDRAIYHYGDSVQLTATANIGWTFSGWSGDLTGLGNPASITIDGNKAVTATFVQSEYSLAVTVVPPAGGSVTADKAAPYHYGDVVTLTETANLGYTFSGWSGDGVGSGSTRQVTITGNMVVTATFTQNQYTLTVNVVPPAGGSVTADKNPPYRYDDVVTLTANPASGWAFSSWGGDLSGSANPASITMNGNMVVTAIFVQNAQNAYSLTVNVVGTGCSVTKSPDQVTYTEGTVVTLTPQPASGWTFSGWSGDLSGSGTPGSITMNGNKVVTATFTQNSYTLTVTSVGSGSVSLNPTGGTYLSGTVVQLTPVAASGWTFSGWSGDLSGSGTPGSITMNGNKVVTATFVQSESAYSLTVISAYGNPSPSVGGHSYSSGASVTCSVSSPVTVGGTVWTCVGWTGTGSVPSSGSGASTTFSITQDSTITWNWKVVQPQRKLTIVSAHGSPNPTVGAYYYSDGQSVGCSVSSPVTENGTIWVCTGWSGTGSVPAGGSGNNVSFVVTQDSSIAWLWSESASPLPPTLSGPVEGAILSSNNVEFSWVSSVGVTDYQIEINGSSSRIAVAHSSSYSANLSSGAYTWRVREYNGTGYGDWSLTRSFTVTVSMVGTESYYISILFGALLATALITYVIVFLKFGLVLQRPRIRQTSLQKENETGS